ncbi:hypothetical protein [Tepidimonas sp.]|uniref:hypothetical protein n=1 Tax=Tepidimonas sp. TaxID=2002775 RepID=UPI00391D2BF8
MIPYASAVSASEPSPDFKGIKTLPRIRVYLPVDASEPSPDFKGIKTWGLRPNNFIFLVRTKP